MSTIVMTAAELVADAESRIENVAPAQVADELANGDVLFVDLREPEERAGAGVIKGAVRAPRGMIESYADPTTSYHQAEFERERRVILHCASGGRSALACDTLCASATVGWHTWMGDSKHGASLDSRWRRRSLAIAQMTLDLIGRHPELAQLREWVSQAVAGQGRLGPYRPRSYGRSRVGHRSNE